MIRLIVPVLLLASPVVAATERYDCGFDRRCDLGAACTADETAFTLAFTGDGELIFGLDGSELTTPFDPGLRTAAFAWGTEVWQLRFTGDGGGFAVMSPDTGASDEAHVMTMHCDPE